METVKKMAMWAGIVFTGLCGIVLLGGGKIVSGTMLIAVTFLMVSPLWRHLIPRWARAGLLCVVFGLVVWNISTTELPDTSNVSANSTVACPSPDAPSPYAEMFPRTGMKFVDQAAHIFSGFLDQAQLS